MKREKIFETILVIIGGLMVLFLILNIKHQYLLVISLGLIVCTLISNYLGEKIVWLWFKLGKILGYINSKILLSIIFYTILFPISLLYKLFNKDNLLLRKKDTSSFYHERNHEYSPMDFENTW